MLLHPKEVSRVSQLRTALVGYFGFVTGCTREKKTAWRDEWRGWMNSYGRKGTWRVENDHLVLSADGIEFKMLADAPIDFSYELERAGFKSAVGATVTAAAR